MSKHIDEILNSMNWEKCWTEIPTNSCQTRIEDDSHGSMSVVFSCDGDAWIEISPDPDEFKRNLRFRECHSGGGVSSRTRRALMILAMAMKADNEDRPQK